MPIHVKHSGQYKPAAAVFAKYGGQWREVAAVWAKQGGVWKQVYQNVVHFLNSTNRTNASIHQLMGSPTKAGNFIFENTATISAATQGGQALTTGAFPAGSTLTIINRGIIAGGGGKGGNYNAVGSPGGTALNLQLPVSIQNTGSIWGGGGGGGGGTHTIVRGGGGGGGAGRPAGTGGTGFKTGSTGTSTSGGTGGAGAYTGGEVPMSDGAGAGGGGVGASGGRGGIPNFSTRAYTGSAGGAAGVSGTNAQFVHSSGRLGGAAGHAVKRNGHAVTWLSGSSAPNVYGPVA